MLDQIPNCRHRRPDSRIVGDLSTMDGYVKVHAHENSFSSDVNVTYRFLLAQILFSSSKKSRGESRYVGRSIIETLGSPVRLPSDRDDVKRAARRWGRPSAFHTMDGSIDLVARARSSVGRARGLHPRGHRFESCRAHHCSSSVRRTGTECDKTCGRSVGCSPLGVAGEPTLY